MTPLAFTINEYQLETPGSDIVELNPQVYWEKTVQGVREVLAESNTKAEEVVAVTCTTQGETMIPVDKDGNELHNAIVWLDARAREEAALLAEAFSPNDFYARTGIPEANAYCPVAKLVWLKKNKPELYRKTHKVLLLEDYLVYRLSGEFVTNPALMCSTGYFDIVENKVWDDILERFGIDPKKIPQVRPCGTKVGTVTKKAAEELGLGEHVVVSTGAMDQVASAIGANNLAEGVITEMTGTCEVVAATVDKPNLRQWSPITVYSHGVEGKYLLVTVSQTAGMVLKWFRDEFCVELVEQGKGNAFNRMSAAAANVPPLSKGVSLFPHLTGMQFPETDESARGVFFGVGLDTGRDCFIRAIMESISYTLRESIEYMGLSPSQVFALGGGAKSAVWNQIKADVCGLNIVTMETEETASLGAAMLGAAACGIFHDIGEAAAKVKRSQVYEPQPEAVRLYEKGYAKYKKMYEQFKPLFG